MRIAFAFDPRHDRLPPTEDRRCRRAATRPWRRFSTRHLRCSGRFRSSRSPPAGSREQAGISVGALYRFYSDRQEIFDAIAVRELDAFRAEIERAFSAPAS